MDVGFSWLVENPEDGAHGLVLEGPLQVEEVVSTFAILVLLVLDLAQIVDVVLLGSRLGLRDPFPPEMSYLLIGGVHWPAEHVKILAQVAVLKGPRNRQLLRKIREVTALLCELG